MRTKFPFLILLLPFMACSQSGMEAYNLNFERIDGAGRPVGWKFPTGGAVDGIVTIDSVVSHSGKYSVKIARTQKGLNTISTDFPAPSSGRTIILAGYLRSQNIDGGGGGLWIRIEDSIGTVLNFVNMFPDWVKGTTGWEPYSLRIGFNPAKAKKIKIGLLLTGTGTIWADDLSLTVRDDSTANTYQRTTRQNSNIQTASLALSHWHDFGKSKDLEMVGKIWGFLKYYHPAPAAGALDWDSVLFDIIPKICSDTPVAYSLAFEQLLTKIGNPAPCSACQVRATTNAGEKSGLWRLFKEKLPAHLYNQLTFITDNYSGSGHAFYVSMAAVGNPDFSKEISYGYDAYPTTALRLLTLFRYWNMIEYYYPYKNLITENWDGLLTEFIPRFVEAKNKQAYLLTCLNLIGHIHDSHSHLLTATPEMDSLKGLFISPFQVKFVQRKLAVAGYYTPSPVVRSLVAIGDIVDSIDGLPVDSLIKRYLPYTPGSNRIRQLRDMISGGGFVMRSNTQIGTFSVSHHGVHSRLQIGRIPVSEANFTIDRSDIVDRPAFELLKNDIGYVNTGKLNTDDIAIIKQKFQNTRGLIIDLRCYPSIFLPFTFGGWLKEQATPFVTFKRYDTLLPGHFVTAASVSNGGTTGIGDIYRGKVVLLVNELTISQAEYTTMALGSSPNAIIIGSMTAGADGNVSTCPLPGSMRTGFSGLGVYYPDGGQTQQVGIKIAILVQPTLSALAEGRDEYLEMALKVLK